MEQLEARQPVSNERKPLGLVWIDCPYPVVAAGLKSALERQARVDGERGRARAAPATAAAAVTAAARGDAEGKSGQEAGTGRH